MATIFITLVTKSHDPLSGVRELQRTAPVGVGQAGSQSLFDCACADGARLVKKN